MLYFSIQELCKSKRANSDGIANIPSTQQQRCIERLITCCLDPARQAFGHPVHVSSGFRSEALNRAIGGASNSQHCFGEAADLYSEDNSRLFKILWEQGNFDQLIWEFGDHEQPQWVHVSYVDAAPRREVLRAVKQNGKTVYFRLKYDPIHGYKTHF